MLSLVPGITGLMVRLMYGSGLRLMECCQLRIEDIDLDRGEVLVRAGKGGVDGVTMLPGAMKGALRAHIEAMRRQHERHLQGGAGGVALPGAPRTKYSRAPWDWSWQWLFPATRHYTDRDSGERRRHHLHESVVQREFKNALQLCWKAGTTSARFKSFSGTAT